MNTFRPKDGLPKEIAQRNSREDSEFGLREARPVNGGRGGEVPGKPTYMRIALQALAAIRSLWGLNKPYQPEVQPYDDNVKMLIGVDLDRMKYKDGTPVPRKEVDRLMALQG